MPDCQLPARIIPLKKSLSALLFLPCLAAQAGTPAWITDKFEVQLRAGSGTQYKILKSLPSGAELTLLDGGETNGYSRVALPTGEEGWISTRYLSLAPVARAEREESSKTLAALREENQRLKAELAASQAGKDAAEKSAHDLGAETARLSSEVTAIRQASANVLQIQNERDQLTLEKVNLESELDTLKREKQTMDASNKQDWFMIGAGVLFGGILLGLVLPRLSWRKKSNWDSF
jgi:SH3 domain protein